MNFDSDRQVRPTEYARQGHNKRPTGARNRLRKSMSRGLRLRQRSEIVDLSRITPPRPVMRISFALFAERDCCTAPLGDRRNVAIGSAAERRRQSLSGQTRFDRERQAEDGGCVTRLRSASLFGLRNNMSPCRYFFRSSHRHGTWTALPVAAAALVGWLMMPAPAHAVPSPDVDFVYNVTVRRHYDFPNGDAIGYGHEICDKVSGGQSFAQVMGQVKSDVTPNDEYAANFLVSYAVSQYCPEQIWQLRKSAAGYQAPPGTESPVSGLQGDVAGR